MFPFNSPQFAPIIGITNCGTEPMPLLEAPLDSVDAYMEFLSLQNVPVLRRTTREFSVLRENEDSISGKQIASVVMADPLMTMKLLTTLQARRTPTQNHDITTIDRAIMMMGVTPFFEAFDAMPTLEEKLEAHPKALVGVLRVISRARRAAHHARDWAILRHDLDVDEVTIAALLLDAVEIMCWTFAPTLALRAQEMRRANHWLRTADAQRAVFGCTAQEIQIALVRAWRLPELLIALMDETHANTPKIRNVRLAADFARHAATGWDNEALPDDIAAIAELVHMKREQLLARLLVPPEELHRFYPPAT